MLKHKNTTQQATAHTYLHSVWPIALVCLAGLAVMLPLLLQPYATAPMTSFTIFSGLPGLTNR